MSKNTYQLPCIMKDVLVIVSDPRAHFAHFKEAIDFVLPEGRKLLACADGEIVDLKQDSSEGGSDPKYNDQKYLNYITIKHSNDEYSQYLHIRKNGCVKKIGDVVKKGELIGYSGNTGLSTTPHLHFQIFVLDDTTTGWHSIKPTFEEQISIDRSSGNVDQRLLSELDKVKSELKK
jgi:murein DD-endopeptidase MepM/ murein hydrolase activator NlpD